MLQSMGSQRVRHDLATEEQEVSDGIETDMNDMFRSRKGCLSRGTACAKALGPGEGPWLIQGRARR